MSEVRETVVANFHEQLLDNALGANELGDSDRLALDNILSGQTYYRKSCLKKSLSDLSFYLTILDSGAAGFAYHNGPPAQGEAVKDLIGRNALDILATEKEMNFPLKTSILDAVYGEYNNLLDRRPDREVTCTGSYEEKANFRSQLVTDRLIGGQKVLLIGLVTEFVRDLLTKNVQVRVSDMSSELEGAEVHGVPVTASNNESTLEQLVTCDAAIVTGAVFSTNTIDSILNTAAESSTELRFYLETGSNFAPHLMDRGAQSVIAEKFPFYDLPGETIFEVYER